MDYKSIASQPLDVGASELDTYIFIRAHLILGAYEKAEKLLEITRPHFKSYSGLVTLLEIQLRVFKKDGDLQDFIGHLVSLAPQLPNLAYLQAEYFFFTGYVHAILDENRQACRYYRLAEQNYLQANQKACAAMAVFNLCVAYDNLNARELLNAAVTDLKTLADTTNVEAVSTLLSQLQGYFKISNEQYVEAFTDLESAYLYSKKETRYRDLGALSWLILYVLIKLKKEPDYQRYFTEISGLEITPEYRFIVGEIDALAVVDFIDAAKANQAVRIWNKHGVNSIAKIFLMDLLIERLLNSQNYEAVLLYSQRAIRLVAIRAMALSQIDFRSYQAIAYFKLGEHYKAQQVLHAYEHDAIESHSLSKMEKARTIRQRFNPTGPLSKHKKQSLVLDTQLHELNFGERIVPLSKKPLLENFLSVLIKEGRPILIEKLFYAVYGDDYSPWRHQQRMNSLIDRGRTVLGSNESLVRREGAVALSPAIVAHLILKKPAELEMRIENRRNRILQLIRKSNHPVSISDLENTFDQTRRTLQFDLKQLVTDRKILTSGGTRGRTYFMEGTHSNEK